MLIILGSLREPNNAFFHIYTKCHKKAQTMCGRGNNNTARFFYHKNIPVRCFESNANSNNNSNKDSDNNFILNNSYMIYDD